MPTFNPPFVRRLVQPFDDANLSSGAYALGQINRWSLLRYYALPAALNQLELYNEGGAETVLPALDGGKARSGIIQMAAPTVTLWSKLGHMTRLSRSGPKSYRRVIRLRLLIGKTEFFTTLSYAMIVALLHGKFKPNELQIGQEFRLLERAYVPTVGNAGAYDDLADYHPDNITSVIQNNAYNVEKLGMLMPAACHIKYDTILGGDPVAEYIAQLWNNVPQWRNDEHMTTLLSDKHDPGVRGKIVEALKADALRSRFAGVTVVSDDPQSVLLKMQLNNLTKEVKKTQNETGLMAQLNRQAGEIEELRRTVDQLTGGMETMGQRIMYLENTVDNLTNVE